MAEGKHKKGQKTDAPGADAGQADAGAEVPEQALKQATVWRRRFHRLTGIDARDTEAVMQWQTAHGLEPTGKVRRSTVQAARAEKKDRQLLQPDWGAAPAAHGGGGADGLIEPKWNASPTASPHKEGAGAGDDMGLLEPDLGPEPAHHAHHHHHTSHAAHASAAAAPPHHARLLADLEPKPPTHVDPEEAFVRSQLAAEADRLRSYWVGGRLTPEEVRAKFYETATQLKESAPTALAYADEIFEKRVGRDLKNPKIASSVAETHSKKEHAREAALQALEQNDLGALVRAVNGLHSKDQRTLIRQIDEGKIEKLIGSGKQEDISALFEFRFGISLGAEDGHDWTPTGLRHAWKVLCELPEQHVVDNPTLRQIVRKKENHGDSFYTPGDRAATISYDVTAAVTPAQGLDEMLLGKNVFGAGNALDQTLRHEFGHAVDSKINASETYGATPAGGGWDRHTEPAKDIVAQSHGAISRLPSGKRDAIVDALEKILEGKSSVRDGLRHHPAFAKLSEDEKQGVLGDLVVEALDKGRCARNPWNHSGAIVIEGRTYIESYDGAWNSFLHEARSRQVSDYQFRAPAEWFAEAYAAYYAPDSRGRGARLGDADKATKTWFDHNVHNQGQELSAKGDLTPHKKT
jgi:hypothetical protein